MAPAGDAGLGLEREGVAFGGIPLGAAREAAQEPDGHHGDGGTGERADDVDPPTTR
jgi:hypothetical protein